MSRGTVRSVAVLLASLALAAPLGAAKPPASPPPPSGFGEVVEVNVVNVDVYAADRGGRRINDLKQGDFELLEDGKPVPLTNFTPVRGPAAAEGAPPGGAADEGTPAPADGWNLVVFVDDVDIQPGHRARALRQVREFLSQGLAPGDRVMLVTADPGLQVRLPFTSDPALLEAALREVEKLSAHGPEIDRERMQAFHTMLDIQRDSLDDPAPVPCPLNIAQPAHDYASTRRAQVLQSLNALTVLVNSLSGVPGRKAVLHVSDGLPSRPGEELFQFLVEVCGGSGTGGIGASAGRSAGPEASQGPASGGGGGGPDPLTVFDGNSLGPSSYKAASQAPLDAQGYSVMKDLDRLVAHANAHQVTLYTLQASGVQGTDASDAAFGPEDRLFQFASIGSISRANHQESLHTLAEGTGGRTILNANDLRADLAGLREDFSTFYSLGFTPAHSGDGKEHKLEVRVKRPGVRLRYRESYRDKPAVERTVDRTLAALLYGLEDNPLGIAVEIGDQAPGPNGTVSVPVKLRIPLFKLAILNHEQTYEGALRLLVVTRGDDGRTSPVRQVAVPIKIVRKEVLNAMGQFYLYTLTLQLPPGGQRIALGVRDEVAATTSYLSRAVTVGTATADARR